MNATSCSKTLYAALFFALQLLSQCCYSQVKGIVLNKATGKPVPDATIWVENYSFGTISKSDGTFVINQPGIENKNLTVSCIGFEKGFNYWQVSNNKPGPGGLQT